MKIADIRADDLSGSGYALIELDNGPAEQLELAFFDLDRREYLWPSSGKTASWRKQPHYFLGVCIASEPLVFRIGPEVCNFVQADSLLQITSRDGSLDHEEIVWPGVPTLDATFDAGLVISDSPALPLQVTYSLPVTKPTGARAHQPEIESLLVELASRSNDATAGEVSLESGLEIDVGVAAIAERLSHPPVSDQRKPAAHVASNKSSASGAESSNAGELRRWLIVIFVVACILVVLIAIGYHNSSSPANSLPRSSGVAVQGPELSISSAFRFAGPAGGPFSPNELRVQLTWAEVGHSWWVESYSASATRVVPESGRLPTGSATTITVSPGNGALDLGPGSHIQPFRIHGSTGSVIIPVRFDVGPNATTRGTR